MGRARWAGGSRAGKHDGPGARTPAQILERDNEDNDDPAEGGHEVGRNAGRDLQR